MIGSRRAGSGLLAAALLLGCGGPQPAPISPNGATPSPTMRASPTASMTATPGAGRPLDTATILAAMRASRRPGGVPDELETSQIAERVAEAVWTVDGEPWDTLTVGGACGPQQCTLEVQGARDGTDGTDAWAFSVDPVSGSVDVVEHTLAALPAPLVEDLDGLARDHETLDGLVRTSARWLGPEAPSRFVLSYREGDEEGGCSVDVTVDADGQRIVDVARAGC